MMLLRILFSIVLWLAYILIVFIPLFLIGLVLVPLATVVGAYSVSFDPVKYAKNENPDVYHFDWPFMWLWDNYEDGIANTTYYTAPEQISTKGYSINIPKRIQMLIQVMYWYFRNPVNNLRLVPYLSCDIYPDKVSFWGEVDGLVLFEPAPPSDDLFERPLIELMEKFDTKTPQWWFAWQGVHSNFFWQFEMPFTLKFPFTNLGYSKGDLMRFWIGWKIYPTDIYGVTEYRKYGAGFALQFKRILKTEDN